MADTVGAARGSRLGLFASYGAGLALGGAAFFGALGALGAWVSFPLIAALVIAAAAAAVDLAGLRVRPQVRFQVPERWRRTMPLPRALFLYGLLLGTGFTTFVPAAAAWALLPLSLALGFPGAIMVGLSFAAGRALSVLAVRDETAFAERPKGLRALRVLAAVSLALALAAGEARAAQVASPAGDPGAQGTDLVWQEPGVGGFLLRNGQTTQLPGNDPAIGGARIAWHAGDQLTIADSATLLPQLQEAIPGLEKLAVSDKWFVYRRALPNGMEQLRAFSFSDTATTITLTHARARGRLGRPSLSGDVVVYHVAGPGGSSLYAYDLSTRKLRLLRTSTRAQLLNPVRLGSKLLYVRITRCGQQLRLGPLDGNGAGRILYKLPPLAGQDLGHERGHTGQGERLPCSPRAKPTSRMLWTTALSGTAAYVTVLRPGAGGVMTPSLLSLSR